MGWLPLYPTTSNSRPLFNFAYRQFQSVSVLIRTAPAAGYRFVSHLSGLVGKYQWPGLKVSNFEQTSAGRVCCFGNHRGIALLGAAIGLPAATPK